MSQDSTLPAVATPVKTKAPRKSTYTREIADEICNRLSEGEPLRQICRDAHMPPWSTVLRWVNEDRDGLADRYARARELGIEAMAAEILEISDDGSNDWIERESERGRVETIVDHDHIQRSKLRVDARKWLLSKMRPDKYGDRVTQEISGPGGAPVATTLEIKLVKGPE